MLFWRRQHHHSARSLRGWVNTRAPSQCSEVQHQRVRSACPCAYLIWFQERWNTSSNWETTGETGLRKSWPFQLQVFLVLMGPTCLIVLYVPMMVKRTYHKMLVTLPCTSDSKDGGEEREICKGQNEQTALCCSIILVLLWFSCYIVLLCPQLFMGLF